MVLYIFLYMLWTELSIAFPGDSTPGTASTNPGSSKASADAILPNTSLITSGSSLPQVPESIIASLASVIANLEWSIQMSVCAKTGSAASQRSSTTGINEVKSAVPTGGFASKIASQLSEKLEKSDMTLAEIPYLASGQGNATSIFCGIRANASNSYGTPVPGCLIETVVNDFCATDRTVTFDVGGYWKTYMFTGYNYTSLYVGLEFDVSNGSCKEHTRKFSGGKDKTDVDCKERLIREVVDRC